MLTPAQMAKKAQVEAAGQVFIPPYQYKAMMKPSKKPGTKRSAVKVAPQQVASYAARKQYKSDFKDISPDASLLIDQVLNPEDCNQVTRWPNTYGLSAVYKSKNILNARFSDDNRCCVAVNPTIKDSIFTTSGISTTFALVPYNTNGVTPNPFSVQSIVLQSTNTVVDWSSPIILANRQAILPFPNAQTGKLLYPASFAYPVGATVNTVMSFRFPNALGDQAGITITTYDSSFQVVRTASAANIGLQGNPAGIGQDIGFVTSTDVGVEYFSIELFGKTLPYYGDVFMFMRNEESNASLRVNMTVPNHAQHVSIFDIRDAETIANSATQAFILAQSLLLTPEMSDLNNGGVLAVARVPAGSVVGEGDTDVDFNTWYDWIASLPYNAHDGGVKKGGYAWYLPEDETGFFYRPLDTYFQKPLPYLVSEFTSSDTSEASVVRIKVVTLVQFTTTSSVYDTTPSGHIQDPGFVHHMLSLIPAAYPNDTHKEQLKKLLQKTGKNVVTLLKKPKTYAQVAELLLGLAL